jgi:hypothetical protein
MLPRVMAIGIPVFIAFGASAKAFAKERTLATLVQLVGAVCLLVVLFAHLSEALGFLPAIGWGQPNTVGHYIDLACAITGVVLLAVGYVSRRFLQPRNPD